MTNLLTDADREALLSNGRETAQGKDIDPVPVVKLFFAAGAGTWLLTELDPSDEDIAFGLCDLGIGEPELGPVSLSELSQLRGLGGLGVERDRFFQGKAPLSVYADHASTAGRIVSRLPDSALTPR